MSLPKGVTRRGGVYQLLVLIPDELRHLYPRTSKGELATARYRASLKTADKHEASAKALALRAEFEAEFVQKRKSLAAPLVRPAPALRAIIAQAVYADQVAWDETRRRDKLTTVRMVSGVHSGPIDSRPDLPEVSRLAPLPHSVLAQRSAFNRTRLQWVQQAIAAGDLANMIPLAAQSAKRLGLEVEWDSDEGAATLEACLQAHARACEVAIQRDLGQIIETPKAPTPSQAAQDAPGATESTPAGPTPKYRTIRDLLPLWVQKTKPTDAALGDVNRALQRLAESGIPTELATLRGSHGATFRDWLRDTEARGISQKTASDRFGAIKTLLSIGTEYDAIATNPWATLRFQVTGSRRRTPFTHEELKAIHQSPQFSQYVLASGGKSADAVPYFMPLLGLFTGARLGELVQLELVDLKTQDGVAVLDIHDFAEGSTLKTVNALRTVPVHPELVRLGLLDYAADLRTAGEAKLFPTLHRPGTKTSGYIFGQAFRKCLDHAGVTRELATFHAYRHGFRSRLENAGASTVRIHRIVGHADGSVDARYTHLDLPVLAEEVAKVAFPFLDLKRVYPAPKATSETN